MTNESNSQAVQIELLRPSEITAALSRESTVYLPLGTIEWHCRHLPVGLDGLTAHGVCIRAALDHGGLVYPPLYFGTGGGHGEYPWTVMMPDPSAIVAMVNAALARLAEFGVQRAVVFTGHFADEQLDMVDAIAADWNSRQSAMRVVGTGINRAEGLAIAPDHAGVFETTMLHALWPDRVDLNELKPVDAARPLNDDFADTRHDHDHELWGVLGPDPRRFDPSLGPELLTATATWLAAQ
jgi:creatinine amidohydrolase